MAGRGIFYIMNNQVDWGFTKATLLFLGLVTFELSNHAPLSFSFGLQLKEACEVMWPAFSGSFIYLLKPPTQKKDLPADQAGGK